MNKNKKFGILAVLTAALLITALITGCSNEPGGTTNYDEYMPPAGMGAAAINIIGTEYRTIYPDIDVNIFESFRFVFTATTLGETKTVNVDKGDETDPIALVPGTYTLVVTAYMDEVDYQLLPAATATKPGVEIYSGDIETISITLSVYDLTDPETGDEGTFEWDLTFTFTGITVTTAEMTITKQGGTTPIEIDFINASAPPAFVNLKSSRNDLEPGYYDVVFYFEDEGGNTLTFKQTLWVYKNLTSLFIFEFTAEHFVIPKYKVTFYDADGITEFSSEDCFRGYTVDLPPTPPLNSTYDFIGWFDKYGALDNDWGNTFTDSTPVMSDINLYPKYFGDGELDIDIDPIHTNAIELEYDHDNDNGVSTPNLSLDEDDAITLSISGAGSSETFTTVYIANHIDYSDFTWTWKDQVLGNDEYLEIDTDDVFDVKGDYLIYVDAILDTEGTPYSTFFTVTVID